MYTNLYQCLRLEKALLLTFNRFEEDWDTAVGNRVDNPDPPAFA